MLRYFLFLVTWLRKIENIKKVDNIPGSVNTPPGLNIILSPVLIITSFDKLKPTKNVLEVNSNTPIKPKYANATLIRTLQHIKTIKERNILIKKAMFINLESIKIENAPITKKVMDVLI